MDLNQAAEAIRRAGVSGLLVAKLHERSDEAIYLADQLQKLVEDASARFAEDEVAALAALGRVGGQLVVDQVRFSIREGQDGPSIQAEPMGAFGVIRVPDTRGDVA